MGGLSPNSRIFGVGINDIPNFCKEKCHTVWHSMLRRSYSEVYKTKKPTYADVSTCKEWHVLSRFKPWFDEHYRDGFELDKDIIVPGNRVYSPETCCFIPQEINSALIKNRSMTALPLGVSLKKKTGKFIAQLSALDVNGRRVGVHVGSFDNPDDASAGYKLAKQAYLKELAVKWEDMLSFCAYNALMNYTVLD